MSKKYWLAATAVAVVSGVALFLFAYFRSDPGDLRLREYVNQKPPVPVVFTSRSVPASLLAAAPEGEGFHWPGKPFWQAKEGRLRLLKPDGTVHELTWGKQLSDGSRIIDVLSPNVSPDGRKVVFAARTDRSPRRFRIFEVDLYHRTIRRLTGGPKDAGCVRLPPLRYGEEGELLGDEERRTIDYDDIDPVYLPSDHIGFISSRMPDLGRGHARRATHLWILNPDGSKRMRTANRNNDRWPFLLSSGYISFSHWSRNTEVITADEQDIQPYEPDMESATLPTDNWAAFLVESVEGMGERFGHLVKTKTPVWRLRPLFDRYLVYMTPSVYPLPAAAENSWKLPPFRIVQALPRVVHSVPSAKKGELPKQRLSGVWQTEIQTPDGRPVSLATPSPCPPTNMLVAGAFGGKKQSRIESKNYGIYLANAAWPRKETTVSHQELDLALLFDDPNLVDAEPVAVYKREVPEFGDANERVVQPPKSITLANGRVWTGPIGQLENVGMTAGQNQDMAGQKTDTGASPVFPPLPERTVKKIRFYASERDRFDDPEEPRVKGKWNLLREAAADGEGFKVWLPATEPFVLAGFDGEGKIAQWSSSAKDSSGRTGTYYAFAGDHYSGLRPGHYHFCLGCHPGHSGPGTISHPEKLR